MRYKGAKVDPGRTPAMLSYCPYSTCGTLYTLVVVATTPTLKSTTPIAKLQPQL